MKRGKKGQVTIFIILAIIIIVFAVLIYLFYPRLKANFSFDINNPSAFMQTCVGPKIKQGINTLSSHGGSINPGFYFQYNNTKIEYLCYTNEYYKTCVMQRPLLKNHIEDEIKKYIQTDASKCLDKLKQNYQYKGYDVEIKKGEINVEVLPKIVVANFNNSIVLSKKSNKKFDSTRVVVKSTLYKLLGIASSILNWEAHYGDAETTTYMNYYHDLKVEKKKQSDGTTVYILINRKTKEKFQFASRSVAWPPGYGAR